MSELISGKDALIAKLENKDVQYESSGCSGLWVDILDAKAFSINEWITEKSESNPVTFKFRLKPKTITINGIEVPEPFTATHADGEIWYLNYGFDECYGSMVLDESDTPLYMAWRTKEEVKQVVAALSTAFNPLN